MKVENLVHKNERHHTHYLRCGDHLATPIIFVHGWPELSRSWRHQIPFVANLGYQAIAPDMRGYGQSSNYSNQSDYAQEHIVQDMIELLDHLNFDKAIWVGHDWGSPTVWNIATHHVDRCLAIANLCVPFDTLEHGWDGILPHIDRALYPEDKYPAGQWEYVRYYEENFAAATASFDSDPYKVAKLLFRKGNPDAAGQISGTAMTRINGGWFAGGEIPDLPRDEDVVTEEDLQVYAESMQRNSFFGPSAYYMNQDANAKYAATASHPTIDLPVLFLHGRYDYTCETIVSTLADPMRRGCSQLTEHIIDSGHWMAQEQPEQVNAHLATWLKKSIPEGHTL